MTTNDEQLEPSSYVAPKNLSVEERIAQARSEGYADGYDSGKNDAMRNIPDILADKDRATEQAVLAAQIASLTEFIRDFTNENSYYEIEAKKLLATLQKEAQKGSEN